jgi:hypothetical protein
MKEDGKVYHRDEIGPRERTVLDACINMSETLDLTANEMASCAIWFLAGSMINMDEDEQEEFMDTILERCVTFLERAKSEG